MFIISPTGITFEHFECYELYYLIYVNAFRSKSSHFSIIIAIFNYMANLETHTKIRKNDIYGLSTGSSLITAVLLAILCAAFIALTKNMQKPGCYRRPYNTSQLGKYWIIISVFPVSFHKIVCLRINYSLVPLGSFSP